MQGKTKPTKASNIKRTWHLVDVKDKVLGRIATDIAGKLMGKSKPYFVRNLDCGDYVVVINAKHVAVTGKKEKQKTYTNYSGYPGGDKTKALWQMRIEKPTEIIRRAVFGMLPKNKLRDIMITRLYIYPEKEHPHGDKI
ncbi:MAG: 50S ribosomal protein L13 [uncultured bacterium]|uniref:Large ribosomal subunit protein uL13 n=1 Tax=Candidatus Gottesmanbacteria bacterium RIFCSPLOWO2_01_FULL_43_11b TaxID=1798392 RepID=A0A1F6AHU5_9BACT|nr:MAG: 50S ribosomal protein L13 [uncultured bacterium]OGG24308.1 MAG: 50S ribosomal protein L13 [Candidatus Gottesmanbacteria bacterium RIFCSPLOWO2_01_FULL_43_11b]